MRPMSWYCGSHDTQTVASSALRSSTMRFRLCRSDACVMTTPFGADVEPDVYLRGRT